MRFLSAGRILVGGLALLVVAFGLWIIPSNDYIFLPDTAHPVAPLVVVPNGHNPTTGGIYYVDVIIRKATLLERLFGGLHDGADLEKPEDVIPAGLNSAQNELLSLNEMKTSQQYAAAVALRSLGYKVSAVGVGARVIAVEPGFPAAGKLQGLDVIEEVDGATVRTSHDLSVAMSKKRPGQTVRFTIDRAKATKTVTVRTTADPHQKTRASVGIQVADAQTVLMPFKVSIDAGDVGGPSAGLAFALDIVEELGHDVARGNKIAATGEIALDGTVGAIGGIKQKTFGARETGVDAFLVPVQNAAAARRYAHGLRIIPVGNFQQALRALATLRPKSPSH